MQEYRRRSVGRGLRDPPGPGRNRKLITEAVATAKKADIVILALGDNEQTSREAWSNIHLGDRANLDLFGMQNDLVKLSLKPANRSSRSSSMDGLTQSDMSQPTSRPSSSAGTWGRKREWPWRTCFLVMLILQGNFRYRFRDRWDIYRVTTTTNLLPAAAIFLMIFSALYPFRIRVELLIVQLH